MRTIEKDYETAFELEPTKLTKIVQTIHKLLADHGAVGITDTFEVFFSGTLRDTYANLSDVLSLDNAARRITRLKLTCAAATGPIASSGDEAQVDFGRIVERRDNSNQVSHVQMVSIGVRSNDPGWADRTLAEVEEQIERTRRNYAMPTAALVLLLIAAGLVLLLQPLSATSPRSSASSATADSAWLTLTDLEFVEDVTTKSDLLSENELREISTRQLRNVVAAKLPKPSTISMNKRQWITAIVALAMMTCAGTLLRSCYPKAVFLWGDEIARDEQRQKLRKRLWGFVGAIVVGLPISLLAEPISRWLDR